MELTDVQKGRILECYNMKIRAKDSKGRGWDNFLDGFNVALRLCGYEVSTDWVERGDLEGFDVKKIDK